VNTLSASFTAANSVINGINPKPNQTTMGEGQVTGTEITLNVTFTTPFDLPADHYFIVPQVQVAGSGNWLWLSAPRNPPPFVGDLQEWIRNQNLEPDWLRVGTDIVGGTTPPTFNASFSLQGTPVPAPANLTLLGIGGACAALGRLRRKMSGRPA
jgi:hypothetical protein